MCEFKTRPLVFWTTFFTFTAVISNVFVFHFAFIDGQTDLGVLMHKSNTSAAVVTPPPKSLQSADSELSETNSPPTQEEKSSTAVLEETTELPEMVQSDNPKRVKVANGPLDPTPLSTSTGSIPLTSGNSIMTEVLTEMTVQPSSSMDSRIIVDGVDSSAPSSVEKGKIAEGNTQPDVIETTLQPGNDSDQADPDTNGDLLKSLQFYQKKDIQQLETNSSETATISEKANSEPFQGSPWIMALSFSAFGLGALISFGGFHLFARRFGVRTLFTVAVIFSGLATLVAPVSLTYDVGYFIVMRLIQGFGFGALMPTVSSITTLWATLKQTSIWMTILLCSVQVAFMASMLLPAITASLRQEPDSKLDWALSFYVSGTTVIVLGVLWCIVFRDNPRKHPWIGGVELDRVLAGKLTLKKRVARSEVSWKSLLGSASVWAVLIAGLGHFAGVNLILMFSPLHLVSGLNFIEIGLIVVVCGFMQLVGKLIASYSYEIFPSKSETVKVKFFTLLSLFVMGASFLGLGFIDLPHNHYVSVLWIVASGASGLNLSGLYKSLRSIVLGSQIHFLFSILFALSFVLFILLPFFVFGILWSFKSWRIIFVVISALQFVAALFFGFFGSGETGDFVEKTREGRSPFDFGDEEDNISIEAGILEMKIVEPKVLS